jgi:hypothetical protein
LECLNESGKPLEIQNGFTGVLRLPVNRVALIDIAHHNIEQLLIIRTLALLHNRMEERAEPDYLDALALGFLV